MPGNIESDLHRWERMDDFELSHPHRARHNCDFEESSSLVQYGDFRHMFYKLRTPVMPTATKFGSTVTGTVLFARVVPSKTIIVPPSTRGNWTARIRYINLVSDGIDSQGGIHTVGPELNTGSKT
jgi:hypothetical protein